MEAPQVVQAATRTIPQLFRERAAESPGAAAYQQYEAQTSAWKVWTWRDMSRLVDEYARTIAHLGLDRGDRAALLLANGPNWIAFDLAAMSCGLATVPLYLHDSAENWADILSNAGCRLLFVDTGARWAALARAKPNTGGRLTVWIEQDQTDDAVETSSLDTQAEVTSLAAARVAARDSKPPVDSSQPGDLATIIYTSGTTASPKGVMLSHDAILWNAAAVTRFIAIRQDDVFLSLLPLAHAFERTLGCVLPIMAGASVAFARSPRTLQEDFKTICPTAFLGVPRIYERLATRIHQKASSSMWQRWLLETTARIGWARAEAAKGRGPALSFPERLAWPLLQHFVAERVLSALGGRLRIAVSGGAALDPAVARFLCGLGVPLVEGYGLTEAAPVVTATTFEDSLPGSVGRPLHGVQVRLGENGELLVNTPSRMIGYWQNATATDSVLEDGWLHTGDIARIEDGRIFITGRLKDLLALSTGEKVPASVVEAALTSDPLFAQVCVIGDRRPCLVAIAVLDPDEWLRFAADRNLDPELPNSEVARRHVIRHIRKRTAHLSTPSRLHAIFLERTPWTTANALLTPTLKVRRDAVIERYANEITKLYQTLNPTTRESAVS